MFRKSDVDLEIIDIERCVKFRILLKETGKDSVEVFCTEMPPLNIQDELRFLTGRHRIACHVLHGTDKENFEKALEQLVHEGHLTSTHAGVTDRCPACGSDKVKPILYGYVEGNLEKLQEQYHVGGCCLSAGSPDIHCSSCGYEWKI